MAQSAWSAEVSVTVYAASAPTISTTTLPAGTVGTAYSQALSGSTGTWSATGLPPGLSCSSGGTVSGTPTTDGSYTPVFSLTDGSQSTDKVIGMTIAPAAPVISTTSPLTSGNVGSAYLVALAATAAGPVTWSVVSGLPAGLSLNPSTGYLSGTPTAESSGTLVVGATYNGVTTTKNLSITIAAASVSPAEISISALPTGVEGVAYSYTIPASGTAPITFAASGLPSGWYLSSGGVLSNGNPTAITAVPVTVTPTNGGVDRTPVILLLTVVAAAADSSHRWITELGGAGSLTKAGNR